ncbi:MAG: MATE family efflux transporter, partial [Treponema sp.]|nr:MATE family efflux transporter [Treponema sp.]
GGAGFVLGACRQGICFVPVILFLPTVWGVNGILYAQPVADTLSAAVTVCMAIPLHRKLKLRCE